MNNKSILKEAKTLLLLVFAWVDYENQNLKQCGFDKLRKKMVNDKIKKLHKNNFESVSGYSDKNSV